MDYSITQKDKENVFTAHFVFSLMNGKTVPVTKMIQAGSKEEAKNIAEETILEQFRVDISSREPNSFQMIEGVVFNNSNVCAFWLDYIE